MRAPNAPLLAPLLVAALAYSAPPTVAQDAPSKELQEHLRQAMAEAAQPGPEHQRLAGLVGDWVQEITFWPSPGAEPVVVEAAASARMILGGRFLEVHANSEGPFATESVTILGFDRRAQEYTVVGLDTWGTYWISAQGGSDGRDDRVVMHGEDEDRLLGHTQVYDITLEWLDPDTYATEVIFLDDAHTKGDGPFRAVRVVNRRR